MSSNSDFTQEISGTKRNNAMANYDPAIQATENVAELPSSNSRDWPLNLSLGASLLHLFENQLWTDVSFRCQGHSVDNADDRIKAHKVILAARSPVFRAMFYGPSADGKEMQELNTVEAQSMYQALKYMYSESTDLTEEQAPKVMKLAQMYQISGLISYCAKYLKSVLRPDNACQILDIALFFNTHDLRDAACEVIDQKAEEVLQSDGFMQLSETCLTYILKGDTFSADEIKVFHAAIKWSENKLQEKSLSKDGTEKRKMLGEAFFFLRIPSLPVKDFIKCTKGEGYYSLTETEEIIQHMTEDVKDVPSVVCHSAVKRLPLHQEIPVEQQSPKQTTYSYSLDTLLLLKVSKDCILDGVTLQNVTLYKIYDNNSGSRYYQPPEYYQVNKASVFLDGTLEIDDNFCMKFRLVPSDHTEIILTRSVKLKNRDAPYKLRLQLKLENVDGLTLQKMINSRKPLYKEDFCRDAMHTKDCLKFLDSAISCGAVKCAYCNNSSDVNFMKSISVRNICNRI